MAKRPFSLSQSLEGNLMRSKIVFLLMVSTLGSSLFYPLAAAAKSDSNPAILYEEKFHGWRDNSTDPGFNTEIKLQGEKIRISTNGVSYGKAMSRLDPITVQISSQTELVVAVDQIDSNTVATVRVMNAVEPHDSYQMARIQGGNGGGDFKVNLNELTGWEGLTSLWFEIWLEGRKKSIVIKRIYFQDPVVATKRKKEAALRQYTSRSFAPAPGNSIYYEDFRGGVDGWRTGDTDPEFNSEINFEEGAPRIKLAKGKGYCKLLSPVGGIHVAISSSTEMEVCLGDMGTSRVKVDVMTAYAPFDAHTVIPWQTKPGVYRASLADATKWKGEKIFWIQIWMETTGANPNAEAGAVLKYIKISD